MIVSFTFRNKGLNKQQVVLNISERNRRCNTIIVRDLMS